MRSHHTFDTLFFSCLLLLLTISSKSLDKTTPNTFVSGVSRSTNLVLGPKQVPAVVPPVVQVTVKEVVCPHKLLGIPLELFFEASAHQTGLHQPFVAEHDSLRRPVCVVPMSTQLHVVASSVENFVGAFLCGLTPVIRLENAKLIGGVGTCVEQDVHDLLVGSSGKSVQAELPEIGFNLLDRAFSVRELRHLLRECCEHRSELELGGILSRQVQQQPVFQVYKHVLLLGNLP